MSDEIVHEIYEQFVMELQLLFMKKKKKKTWLFCMGVVGWIDYHELNFMFD